MTLAAVHIDALGLPFVLGCLVVYFGFVLFVARFCGLGERKARRQREAERRELDGPMSSVGDFVAHQRRRSDKAVLAQRERWGRSA